ncbi:hypothetical protein [Streptomyces pratensis]|uniref:hypothetical protein n=1 Tax=Streptomyces pratensis TaxID=1169025 RepID=UPI003016028B
MNMQQAAERSDALLDSTFNAINPSVQWAHDDTTSGSCDLTRRRAVMTDISEARRGSFLGTVERFWRESGYEIVSVNASQKYPAIFARTPDGFGINVEIADQGQAHFEVNTPCVEKSEVAAPSTPPNGPAYENVEIPRPNVRSDFWSVATPVPSAVPGGG